MLTAITQTSSTAILGLTPRLLASEAYEKARVALVAMLFLVLNILVVWITYDKIRTDCDPPNLNVILAKSGSSQGLLIVFFAIMYINYL